MALLKVDGLTVSLRRRAGCSTASALPSARASASASSARPARARAHAGARDRGPAARGRDGDRQHRFRRQADALDRGGARATARQADRRRAAGRRRRSLDPLRSIGAQIARGAEACRRRRRCSPHEQRRCCARSGSMRATPRAIRTSSSAPERQALLIAMALAGKPDLLIADEPTSALDLITQRRILDLIDRLCTERGMALMFISHDLKAVAVLCDPDRRAAGRQGRRGRREGRGVRPSQARLHPRC